MEVHDYPSAAVLQSVIASLKRLIGDAEATIEVEPLPRVSADEGQLRQLIQNLVTNAIKFRSDTPPRITISASPDGIRQRFAVADNGIGIEMQQAPRIFQMFQRLHEIGKYPCSGIGLAIAKRIVERHGGAIWVESRVGEGATFYFTLANARR